MKRITDSQVVKHTDGESHEQIYCFGHLWGPAYFKRGSKDYEEYISIVRKLKAYEDTGLEPEEIMDGKMLTGWIPVEERLPAENEYRAVRSAHSSKPFLKRLEIAYSTDTTEYMFGYYDGYKWMDKCNKEIRNVIAWKIHEPFSQ